MTNRPVIADLLRSRYVPRLLTASLIGRLPSGMVPLAILLTVRDHGGDYKLAGMLTACFAASAAVCGPVLGRLIDRTRQPPILLACGITSALALCGLALLNPVHATITAVVLAVIAGAATPQLEPCLRVLWDVIVTGANNIRAAYSLDAATQELIFVCGPVIVLAAVSLSETPAGLLAAAALCLAGTTWFATSAPARAWRAQPSRRHWAGPLAHPGIVRLLMCLVFVGLTVGAFTIGISGHAEANGARGDAAWLLALNAAGALTAGIVYTAAPIAHREDRRLLALLLAFALGYLPLALATTPWSAAPLSFLSGCALPAVLASSFALVAKISPPSTLIEAHAWMITAFGVGYAIGTATAGLVIDQLSVPMTFILAGLAAVTATTTAPRLTAGQRATRTIAK